MATVSRAFSVRNGLDIANTIVIDSNRNLSNIVNANVVSLNATGNIVVAEESSSNVFISSKTALAAPNLTHFDGERLRLFDFDEAGHPNYAIGVEPNHIWIGIDSTSNNQGFKWYGNTNVAMRLSGNGVLEVANTVISNAFITVAGLNVTDQANAAYDQANAAYGQANAAYGQANLAYAAANSAANTVRVSQNSTATLSAKQLNFVNTETITVTVNDSGDGNANVGFIAVGGAAFDQANAAYDQANTARDTANSAYAQANDAYNQANAAYSTANLKVASIAVSGNGLAVTNVTTSNNNDYTVSINTASTTLRGTTLLIDTVDSSDTGNAATANAVKTAWDYANTKLSLSGGTLGGSLNISGNLTVTGQTKYVNVETYVVTDPLIYLAANNETSDLVDIGFMGGHNTAGVYQHSGLARHAADGNWYLFTGLADEGHENNIVDIANTQYALLKANLYAQQLNVVNGFVNVATTLEVGGDLTLKANLIAQQNVNVTGTLNVAGLTEFTNNVLVSAPLNVNSSLNVTGTAALTNTNVNGVLTITDSGEGLVVGNANVTYTLTVGSLGITTNTVTTSSSGQVVLDTFLVGDYASAKYFVQANSTTNYTVTEVTVLQDGTNVWLSEYGTIQSGPSLGTFSADIDSGDVRLLFTANNSVNTIRSVRYGVLPP